MRNSARLIAVPCIVLTGLAFQGCSKAPAGPTPGPKDGSLFLHRNDVKEHTVHVPGLKSESCVALIEAAFRKRDGSRELNDLHREYYTVTANLAERHITVAYNSLVTSSRNIEHLIADAGFAVQSLSPLPHVEGAPGKQSETYEIPANKAAYDALPKDCK